MNKAVAIPLDSLRLIQQCAAPLHCFVCDQANLLDTELCRHCSAPLALTYQAGSQDTMPHLIAAVGSSGAGKTVYLGMLLDMLSRLPDRLQLLARGAFSVTLQQRTAAALARCEFPSKTPVEPDRWNWVHCEMRLPNATRPLEIIIPDMAGEALFAEIEHPRSFRVVRPLLQQSQAALVLVDAYKLQQGTLDEEFYGMKLLSYLGELRAGTKRGWPARPLAVVFTKADQCQHCFDDADAFAERQTPGLWRLCRERFRQHRFFASGVAGACAYRAVDSNGGRECVPLRIEPRGIVEPFEWILSQLKGI